MAEENIGCFAWLISFKKTCNERWAKFRNSFRRRFYTRRGKTLDPDTLLSETGARDMVITKTHFKSNKVVPQSQTPRTAVEDEPAVSVSAPEADAIDVGFDKLVEKYVSCIIVKAADTLRQAALSNTKTVCEKSADDNASLSSSIISQIAGIAVTENLSNVMLDADTNHSATLKTRPKTIKELKEAFGIVGGNFLDDDLPTVSV